MSRRGKHVRRAKRWALLGVLAALVAGAIGTGIYLFRGREFSQEGSLPKIEAAFRAHNWSEAVDQARKVVAREPANRKAREYLIDSLVQGQRLDEARLEAEKILDHPEFGDLARVALSRIAFRLGDLTTADRYARVLVDTRPVFAHNMLSITQDWRGILRGNGWLRLSAAATMRGLASLSTRPEIRVRSLIHSASITLEVAPYLEKANHLVAGARDSLKAAVTAAGRAHQGDRSFPYEYSMGLIRIMSADETEAELGARILRKYAKLGDRRDNEAIAQIVLYHARRGQDVEALDMIRNLSDNYHQYRILWVLQHGRHRELALKILTAGPDASTPGRVLMRADLLLQGGDRDKARARVLLDGLLKDQQADSSVVVSVLRLLAMRAGIEVAREAAIGARVGDRKDRRITALLAVLLHAGEDKDHALELVRELASQATAGSESTIIRMLGGGGDLVESYLDAQIEKGGDAALRYRIGRAFARVAKASREKDGSQDQTLKASVGRDLSAILAEEGASRRDLLNSFWIATHVGDGELGGRLLGRALATSGEPELLAARILDYIFLEKNREVVRLIAKGIEVEAGRTAKPGYLRAFARIMVAKDSAHSTLVDELEQAAQADAGSRIVSLELACRIALGDDDIERAESFARSIVAADPGAPAGRELLGAILLRSDRARDVVAMYTASPPANETGYRQLTGAYVLLKQYDKALETAEKAVLGYPGHPAAYVVLARIHRGRGDKDKALGVLNIAPAVPMITQMRADLLEQVGDFGVAEQLYGALLAQSRFRNMGAWAGLKRVLAAQGRQQEFIDRSARVLASRVLGEDARTVRSSIHFLRGQTLEQEGKLHEALADYEKSLEQAPDSWAALNNTAWHIATLSPARIETARVNIEKARKLMPESPTVLDTAAEVFARLKQFEKALGYMDQAIERGPEEKSAAYHVHKAGILVMAGREAEARSIVAAVLEKHSGTPAAKSAKELVWKLDIQNMPEDTTEAEEKKSG